MTRACRTLALIVASITLLARPARAHDDDPKVIYRAPAVQGVGWKGDGSDGRNGRALFPAYGVELLSWMTLAELGPNNSSGADCWGYVSPAGREYALIGVSSGTAVVEVTQPRSPVLVGTILGPQSLWHDVQIYQHYAYAVSEGGNGIQVIDLANIDAATNRLTLVREVTTGGTTATHTVIVNEQSGYLYRCGGGGLGLRIYSLADPANPTYVTGWHDRYIHEALIVSYTDGPYAGREIAFCCSGYDSGWTDPGLDILDVTDKQNIVNLYPQRVRWTPAGYSHQVWLSEDRRYAYINDELDEYWNGIATTTIVIDVSSLTSPVVMPSFANSSPAIGHNLYVKGDYIYEANYRSGLRVFDASNPLAPVEVAWFDTWPTDDQPSFNGLWGNYPFLPSGIVLGSDLERGLFVWRLRPDVAAGDMNCDGSVNGFDVDGFVLAISDPDAYNATYPDCSLLVADLNGDGSSNGFDVDAFVDVLDGG
ncbi:MAG: hypothetical protein CHACPFDD_03893 [Phycisphaerae bacterium]|nr:hypothetical protein [Phycisphaerae bacterium]